MLNRYVLDGSHLLFSKLEASCVGILIISVGAKGAGDRSLVVREHALFYLPLPANS